MYEARTAERQGRTNPDWSEYVNHLHAYKSFHSQMSEKGNKKNNTTSQGMHLKAARMGEKNATVGMGLQTGTAKSRNAKSSRMEPRKYSMPEIGGGRKKKGGERGEKER